MFRPPIIQKFLRNPKKITQDTSVNLLENTLATPAQLPFIAQELVNPIKSKKKIINEPYYNVPIFSQIFLAGEMILQVWTSNKKKKANYVEVYPNLLDNTLFTPPVPFTITGDVRNFTTRNKGPSRVSEIYPNLSVGTLYVIPGSGFGPTLRFVFQLTRSLRYIKEMISN